MRRWAGLCAVGLSLVLAACQASTTAPPATAKPAATTAAPAKPASSPVAAPAPGGAASAPAAPARPTALEPPVTVRVGALSSISDSGFYIGYERGYYRELGLDLQLETIPDPNAISTSLAANQLEVGGFGVNANPFQV